MAVEITIMETLIFNEKNGLRIKTQNWDLGYLHSVPICVSD